MPACNCASLPQHSSTAEDLAAQRIRRSGFRFSSWGKQTCTLLSACGRSAATAWRWVEEDEEEEGVSGADFLNPESSSARGGWAGGETPVLCSVRSLVHQGSPVSSSSPLCLLVARTSVGQVHRHEPRLSGCCCLTGESVRRPCAPPRPGPLHAVLWAGPSSESTASICECADLSQGSEDKVCVRERDR